MKNLMAQSSTSRTNSSRTKKKIKVHKQPSASSSISSTSFNSEEDSDNYVTPAARDSKWVGLNFYNPNFEVQEGDEENEEEEIRVMNVDDEEELPIYSLFPKLRENFPERKSFIDSGKSTTDIIRSLVGQKPNFTYMKRSNRVTPIKMNLPSLKEIPNEETAEEERLKNLNKTTGLENKPNTKSTKTSSDKKVINRISQPTVSCTSKEHYDEEDSDTKANANAKKKRRTKKKTDIPKNMEVMESSYSGLNQPSKRPMNKHKPFNGVKSSKRINSKEQKAFQYHSSSHGSLADEESV